jgi:hypothetical protein
MRIGLAQHGVRVTLVSLCFIDTETGQQQPERWPFGKMPADVAFRIAKAAARGQAQFILPWPFAWLRIVDRLMPGPLRERLLLKLVP